MRTEGYTTPTGVEAAIKDAAKKARISEPSLGVSERIRLEHFDRFLCRVFSSSDDEEWLLKGGTSLLARVAAARATTDIDLLHRGVSLEMALMTDQIADKVCAMLGQYRGRPSSRVKDLVDLVLIAATQTVSGAQLHRALQREASARGMELPSRVVAPSGWSRQYERLAEGVPACRAHRSSEGAQELLRAFIDPAVQADVSELRWDPEALAWGDPARSSGSAAD